MGLWGFFKVQIPIGAKTYASKKRKINLGPFGKNSGLRFYVLSHVETFGKIT